MRILKTTLKLLLLGIVLLVGIIFGSHLWVQQAAKDYTYNTIQEIPKRKVGLLLGTSKKTIHGNINLYFKYRMTAAATLFKAGKIDYIIVSGDNSIKEYNETRDMKNYLVTLGVPANKIIEDYAGFRTLDSVVRTKEVFGQNNITIISQQFHNQRAIFIAQHHNINAIAFNAQDVSRNYSYKTILREYLARVKAVLDVRILNTMPKFYQQKEIFPTDSIIINKP